MTRRPKKPQAVVVRSITHPDDLQPRVVVDDPHNPAGQDFNPENLKPTTIRDPFLKAGQDYTPGDLNLQTTEVRRLRVGGHDALECMLAGVLVLHGCARGATGMTAEMAAAVLEVLVQYLDELEVMERKGRDPLDSDNELISEISIQRNVIASQALDIVSVLTGAVDWKQRALEAEAQIEQAEYSLGIWESGAREFLGPGERSIGDIRMLLDSLRGSVLAAEQQRNEQAAFALDLLQHIRQMPTQGINEGLENIHHSICMSPRTAASEAVSYSYLEEAIEAKAHERGEVWRLKYEDLRVKTIEALERGTRNLKTVRGTLLEVQNSKVELLQKLEALIRVYTADAEALERRVVARFWQGICLGIAGGVVGLLVLRALVG